MLDDRTGGAAACPSPEDGDGLICLSRDPGDLNHKDYASLGSLRNPHMATETGGLVRPLPHPMLAVYVFCDEVPGVAHGCTHGPGKRHSIKCIVNVSESARTACEHLYVRSGSFRPRATYRSTVPA